MLQTDVPSRDKLPPQKDYKQILIATVDSSSDLDSAHIAGNILDSNEQTTWRVKGKRESLTINLPTKEDVRRIVIEWDPELPRDKLIHIQLWPNHTWQIDRNGYLFTVWEVEKKAISNTIKILFPLEGTYGISTIAIYGYDYNKERKT